MLGNKRCKPGMLKPATCEHASQCEVAEPASEAVQAHRLIYEHDMWAQGLLFFQHWHDAEHLQ